ncbi:hypothetical protein OG216_45895 (plasmid) [Streptomycetaceae bacterium NBC_01309]
MSVYGALSQWNPGLEDSTILRAAYTAMPGDPQTSIPWPVRLAENPASPIALPGAVDLFGHDCIHIVLGRGALPQDEAFIVGTTMGASGRLRGWQQSLFTAWARATYRGPFRWTAADRQIFELAVRFGRTSGMHPLHSVNWHAMLDVPLGEIRRSLGIQRRELLTAFAQERMLLPHTPASQRLPGGAAATTSASRARVPAPAV